MNRFQAYLHQKLDPIYPTTEIGSFSRLLLIKLAGMSTLQIYSDKDRHFPEQTLQKLFAAIDRLTNKEPIQYILGETEFFGLPFHIGPGALIPRPETEELVELILKHLKNKQTEIRILDIGTGSGCIAISLAKALPNSKVTGWDVSPDALKIASENAVFNNVDIQFELKDVLNFKAESTQKASFDIIVSNPPYVCQGEASNMDVNVLDHEPHVALFVEDSDALIFYRVIATLAIYTLKPGGSLFFEINSNLGQETLELIQTFPFYSVELLQDISGKDRMIQANL